MDVVEIIKYIFVPLLGVIIGYQQYLIRDLVQRVNLMVTREEFIEELHQNVSDEKERLNDRLGPINNQLGRIENKTDKLIDILINKP